MVGTLLSDVLANHAVVTNRFRMAATGNTEPYPFDVTVGPQGFAESIAKAYGAEAAQACLTSEDKDSPWKKVKEGMEKIGNLGESMQNGTKDWETAFKLLDSKAEKSQERERQLL